MKPSNLRLLAPVFAFLALVLMVGVSSCNGLPKRRGATVVEGIAPEGTLETVNPSDIIVAPIVNETGRDLPADELREAFVYGLVKRRYSPLSIDFVDSRVIEGSYAAGSLGEDAVLTIYVENWDTTYWETNSAITVRSEVRLLDAKTSDVLWSGRIDRRFDATASRARADNRDWLLREACNQIAGEMLAALPPRQASPGR